MLGCLIDKLGNFFYMKYLEKAKKNIIFEIYLRKGIDFIFKLIYNIFIYKNNKAERVIF